jgi:hypothetical protein
MKNHITAAFVCMGIVLAGIVQAASVPCKINYQGVLKDNAGVKIDGSVDIDVVLQPLGGGAAVFSETHTGVSVANGLFSLKIGDVNDMCSVPFDSAYELEITVDGDTMAPNTPLCAAPYALGVLNTVVGPTGPQGVQGKIGPAGTNGTNGTNGTDGVDGTNGTNGTDGGDGTNGTDGAQGVQGKVGPAGGAGTSSWVDGTGQVTTTAAVGIGTVTTPTALIDASAPGEQHFRFGSTNSPTKVFIGQEGGLTWQMYQEIHFGHGWKIGGWPEHNFRLQHDSSTRLFIDDSGKVGIGTDSPGSRLAVVGLPTSDVGLSAGSFYWEYPSGTLKIKY